jgi:hypothetical protein
MPYLHYDTPHIGSQCSLHQRQIEMFDTLSLCHSLHLLLRCHLVMNTPPIVIRNNSDLEHRTCCFHSNHWNKGRLARNCSNPTTAYTQIRVLSHHTGIRNNIRKNRQVSPQRAKTLPNNLFSLLQPLHAKLCNRRLSI